MLKCINPYFMNSLKWLLCNEACREHIKNLLTQGHLETLILMCTQRKPSESLDNVAENNKAAESAVTEVLA